MSPPSKNGSPVKPLLFENLVGGSTPPPATPSKQGVVQTMASDKMFRKIWVHGLGNRKKKHEKKSNSPFYAWCPQQGIYIYIYIYMPS